MFTWLAMLNEQCLLVARPKTWSTLIYTCYKCRSNVWYQTKWHILKCCICFAWSLIKEICRAIWPIYLDHKHVLSLWYTFNKLDLHLWYIIRSFYNQQLVVSSYCIFKIKVWWNIYFLVTISILCIYKIHNVLGHTKAT